MHTITLVPGGNSPSDPMLFSAGVFAVLLSLLPAAQGNDVVLVPMGPAFALEEAAPPSEFPTQFSGLRYYDGGVQELCLVATADAHAGPQLRLYKSGTTYCVYLVDTSDPDASPVRIDTGAGVKAVRFKT